MGEWTKVVTEPLGLAGFALFLVFGLFTTLKLKQDRRWLRPLAASMAVAALAGGLVLAYMKAARESAVQKTPVAATQQAPEKAESTQIQTTQLQQMTTGAGSPVVQGVKGDVTITVDQSGTAGARKKAVAAGPAKTR